MTLDNNKNRTMYIGALNAVLKYLGVIEKTIHCTGHEPLMCESEIGSLLKKRQGVKKLAQSG